jgi:predicted ATPase/DNA-binding CsgD family transcriptional regulator
MLPVPLTPILGRDLQIGQIVQLLDRDDLRVVTLLGPGGMGKTRLAQEVARLIESDFADGACFVPLASVRDSALVPKAVALSLGLQESGTLPAEALLVNVLAEQHLLIVLDNFEQVVEAAASWLTSLIASCPRLKILVTSRIALNIDGEQRFVVPPLHVPEPGAVDLRQAAAVNLFAQRARAIDVTFEVDERNQATVADICRRLDGLPLAIELAAARVNVLSPEAILARLSHRLDLLAGGRRDVPSRRRSMREAIGWSYDLLSEEERILFGRLSVFVGSFSLEAAAFVAGHPAHPVPAATMLDALNSLVDQSLVHMVSSKTGTRFGMFETIREFGLARIDAEGRGESAHCAHADYFVALGAMAEGNGKSHRAEWLDVMEAEHHNIRAASLWLADHGRLADAIDLNEKILYYPRARGHTREARALFEDWLRHPSLVPRSRAHAVALVMAAGYGFTAGDFAEPYRMLDEAVEIFRELDDDRGLILAMAHLATAPPSGSRDDIDASINRIKEGIELARKHGEWRYYGLMVGNLGRLYESRGDIEHAHRMVDELERFGRASGDLWHIAAACQDRASDALRTGDLDQARRMAEENLRLCRELGDPRHASLAQVILGTCAQAAGDFAAADSCVNPALQTARALGDRQTEFYSLIGLSNVALAGGEIATASAWMSQLFEAQLFADSLGEAATCLDVMAGIAQRSGRSDQAARFLGAADGILDRLDTPRLWKHDVDAYHELVGALRASLGTSDFDRLTKEGRELSTDEAIQQARASVSVTASAIPGPEPPSHPLSVREVEVLTLMADGLSNAEIADRLYLSLRTVTSHITNILGKLDVSSRTAAVAYAIRNGIA